MKSGKQIHSERNKKDIQAKINEILGYSYDLFINSIIFGQKLKRIIEESGPQKKKIFDEAFETLFVDKAKKLTESEREKTRAALGNINDKVENLSESLITTRDFYEDAIAFEKNFKSDKKENLAKIKAKLEKLSDKKKEVTKKLSKLKSIDNDKILLDIQTVEEEISKLSKDVEKVKEWDNKIKEGKDVIASEINKLTKLSSKKCFTCGQSIDKDKISQLSKELEKAIKKNKEKTIELKRKIKSKDISKTNSLIKSQQDKLEELNQKLYSIKSNKKLKKQLESELSSYNDDIKDYEKDLKKENESELKIKSPKYNKKIGKLESKLKKLKKQQKILDKQEDIQDWLINDPLSNKGLKAYIFNSLLDKVNDNLDNYSDIIGFRIEFGIDLESSNKDFYQMIFKGDNIINYADFSGGQKQLIDTTVALAIHEVISSVRPINLLFMDEPFEGLDKETIEVVSEIISRKAKEQNVYLITHHDSFNPHNSNTIYFELDSKGHTKIT